MCIDKNKEKSDKTKIAIKCWKGYFEVSTTYLPKILPCSISS